VAPCHRFARLGAGLAAVAVATVVLVTATPGHAGAAAAAPARTMWVQGDSVLLGAVDQVQAGLRADGWTGTVTAFSGLQLYAAVPLFRQEQANLGSVVVVELGANSCCDLGSFSSQMDQAMTAIGPHHVIWLTTPLFRPFQVQMNAVIRQTLAKWPNAEVADWGAVVAANPQAVYADGLHLTPAGRSLLAAFIQAHLDGWYRQQLRGPTATVVTALGRAPADGPDGGQPAAPSAPVGMAATPDGGGYWVVSSDGTVRAEGDATDHESVAAGTLADHSIVGMAATSDGGGYWLAADDGSVFAFGDAASHGSMVGVTLNQPVVGMAATPDGGGYWLVASDGGVFAFGDAAFHGSMGAVTLNEPIVGIAATPDGGGYWMVAADGGVFSLGDARFEGSTGAMHVTQPVQSMAASRDGGGYWLVGADGTVYAFGDAPFLGSAPAPAPGAPAVIYAAIAATPSDTGYWLLGGSPGPQ
jgi:lysophospholipase L1-like esterase